MVKINENYLSLKGGYLFSEIARRVAAFKAENPDAEIMRLGIGDVSLPLAPAVCKAMKKACDEMGKKEEFRGYGPDPGYEFLRRAIADNDYRSRGIEIDIDEIFVSDGAKSDCGNIGDIFSVDNTVAVCDPVYTVYVDTNVMSGRAGEYSNGHYSKLVYLPCTEENGFVAEPPVEHADIVYLCFPNNPTGAMATKKQLEKWVEYAKANGAVLLYDAAYEAFITDPDLPHSIYEIEGARECAIEFRSFSKTAGFTGTRCAFTVVPKALKVKASNGEEVSLNSLWLRRQGTKFNGVSYITQRGAEAVYSAEGKKQVAENIRYYLENAKIIFDGLTAAGFKCAGGVNSPYVWVKVENGMSSWEMFDELLNKCHVVTTPGEGFGPCGEGYIRLSALGDREITASAVRAIVDVFGKKQ
mgnify:FL=1